MARRPDTKADATPRASAINSTASGWSGWWREQSAARKLAPGLIVLVYLGTLFAIDTPRNDHILICATTLVLAYGGRTADTLLRFLMPLLLTGTVYDTQRYFPRVSLTPVHVSEPYQFDLRLFGIETATGVLTPAEWLQLHTLPVLDLICGFFYLTYVAQFLGIAAWFRFRLSRTGTARMTAARIAGLAPRLMWAFFWLNMLGYLTYYIYPAAPPWYAMAHGFGPAKLDAAASAAGCARFDLLLGTRFFDEMYSRSANVFGAIPSLHIAYPLLAAWYAVRFGSLRVYSVVFFLIMSFAAVYLNHHYVLDLLWGAAYALIVAFLMDRVCDRRDRQRREIAVAGPN